MKLLVFAVHDVATEAYMHPWFARSVGEAVRSFTLAVNDESHQFSRHSDDYTLFKIGEYDDSTGEIVGMVPMSLGNALEYRKPKLPSAQLEIEDALREVNNGR